MPALQVRDFPEDLYEGLKEYAKQQHRSMAQQTIKAVEEMLANGRDRNYGKKPRILSYESLRERDAIIAKRKAIFERIQKEAKEPPANMPPLQDFIDEWKAEREKRGEEKMALLEGVSR